MDLRNNNYFSEGDNYEFFISKQLVFQPDNEKFFLLISPFDTKHLLPEKYYKQYALQVGEYITCRIDKINCSGRIFLEPDHPYYKIGNVYKFPIINTEKITNTEGKEEEIFVLNDVFDNKIYINAMFFSNVHNSQVTCRVERIKKGRIYLLPVDWNIDTSQYQFNEYYFFRIISICTLSENEEYYLLSDEKGMKHFLRKKYYVTYGFQIGEKIKCRFTDFSNGYGNYLEPEHPTYSIGKIYYFKVVGFETILNEKQEKICLLKVNDGSDKESIIRITTDMQKKITMGDFIACKVQDIRNGRLKLCLV